MFNIYVNYTMKFNEFESSKATIHKKMEYHIFPKIADQGWVFVF